MFPFLAPISNAFHSMQLNDNVGGIEMIIMYQSQLSTGGLVKSSSSLTLRTHSSSSRPTSRSSGLVTARSQTHSPRPASESRNTPVIVPECVAKADKMRQKCLETSSVMKVWSSLLLEFYAIPLLAFPEFHTQNESL